MKSSTFEVKHHQNRSQFFTWFETGWAVSTILNDWFTDVGWSYGEDYVIYVVGKKGQTRFPKRIGFKIFDPNKAMLFKLTWL